MTKYTLLTFLLILCLYAFGIQSYAFCGQTTTNCNKDSVIAGKAIKVQNTTKNCIAIYKARITSANYRSKVNYQGKSLRGLAKRYGNICAVGNKIPLWSRVYIPKTGQYYLAVDKMATRSVAKHKSRYNVIACVDIYRNCPTKQLRKKDLGITEIHIYE